MSNDMELIRKISEDDLITLKEKGVAYGESWKQRGGIGAFMMLARKWDRIENQAKHGGSNMWDVFSAGIEQGVHTKDNILDDIKDLRCYLLLVEAEIRTRCSQESSRAKEEAEASKSYIDQD